MDEATSTGLDSATSGFIYVLVLGVVVAIVLFLIFCFLRPRVPDVFYHRRALNQLRSENDINQRRVRLTQPIPSDSFFGWIGPLWATTEESVLDNIGLDAVMFLRYLRTSFYILAILALFSTIILMPVFATAQKGVVQGLRIVSLGNVPENSPRLWAVVVLEFMTAAVVLFFVMKDLRFYASVRRKYRISETPSNYSVAVLDIPADSCDEKSIRSRFELVVPSQIAHVILIRKCAKALKLQKNLDAAVTNREVAEYVKAMKDVSPEMRPGLCGCLMCHKPKVDSIEYWKGQQEELSSALRQEGTDAPLTSSAIMVLTNKRAASVLVQANSSTSSSTWNIEQLGEPETMHWAAFNIPSYQVEIRGIAVATFVLFFTLFWTIPAGAIVALFSLQRLQMIKGLEWTGKIAEISPLLGGLVEGALPPVVMSVLISLIPTLFRFVIGHERLVSSAVIERKTRDYFMFFTVYGSFFVIALGQSFFQDIDAILENPVMIVNALAKEVPGTGVFFSTFILLQAFIPLILQLSGVVRVIVRFILLKISKTERQKRKARLSGGIFQYFRYSGNAMLVMFLAIMFSSFAPLVGICGTLYFFMAGGVFKFILLYTTRQPWESGGLLYPGAYWGTLIGLILKQFVVVAVLGLKKAPTQAVICVIPAVITIFGAVVFSKRYSRIAEFGSLHDMSESSAKLNEMPSQYVSAYKQPAGKETMYENMNGLEEAKDTYDSPDYGSDSVAIQSEHADEQYGYVPDRAAAREEV